MTDVPDAPAPNVPEALDALVPDAPDAPDASAPDAPDAPEAPPAASSNLKQELLKLGLIMAVAAAVLGVFLAWPSLLTVVGGVLVIAASAWLSERRGRGYPRVVMSRRAVLVTGCDSGFGHALAARLASLGVRVYAGCLAARGDGARRLREAAQGAQGEGAADYLHVLQLDVTDDGQVAAAVSEVREMLGEHVLWGVVNNAGLNFLGDLELTTMAQYERCVQVNQLGMVRVTKACLPLIRKSRGRFVNVTSVKGTLSESLCAAYTATKFAGEAFSDCLRREAGRFGVKVAIIQPCNFGGATDAVNMKRMSSDFEAMWSDATDEVRSAYGRDYLDHFNVIVRDAIPTACTKIERVTNAMMHALFAEKPKTRYLVNGSTGWIDIYWIRSKLVHYLPTSWFDAWLRRDMKGMPLPKAACLEEDD